MTLPDPELRYFFETLGGRSFNGGLYRTVHPADLRLWNGRIRLAFPDYAAGIICFGYDWLGTAFALKPARLEEGRPGVAMFDLASGDAMEVSANLITFHEKAVFDRSEETLVASFYEKWRASGGAAPAYDQCIGFKVPLFLGGEEEVDNLEVSTLMSIGGYSGRS